MKQHNQSYALYYSLLVGGVICFMITSLMGYLSAVSQSSSGGLVLGAAFIAIHIIGVAVMGSVSGSFARRRRWFGATATGIIVVGAALLSSKNTTDYYATERASLIKARQAQAKAQEERSQAALEATKKRQALQEELARGQMKWIQGTKGRNQADMAEQGRELIKDIGKADVSMPDVPKTEIITRAEYGNELVAKIFGWDKDTIELTQMLYASIFIIILESILWPLAAFFKPVRAEVAMAIAATTAVAAVAEPVKAKLLAAPKDKDKPITIRVEPDPEWRALLDRVDYPSGGGRYKGPPRPRDKREHLAPKFYLWLQAFKEIGDHTTDQVDQLYQEYSQSDHRSPWGMSIVKKELEALGKRFASKYPSNGTTMWEIQQTSIERATALLEKRGVLTVQNRVSTLDPEPDPEPDTEPEADPSESKLLGFPLWRTRQAGGQVH